jgi:N-acetylglutamate synthase-like GNAT family acetyltransferase
MQEPQLKFQIIPYGGSEHQEMLAIRQEVLRTPLGLVLRQDEVERDKGDTLIAGYLSGKICSTAILKVEPDGWCRFRQVAVKTEFQGKGVGKNTILNAEKEALKKGLTKAFLFARVDAVPFYEKLGYHIVGDEFIEVTIPHIRMEKAL